MSTHVVWCFVPLCRPLGLVISFYIKTRYNKHLLYCLFHFVALCVKIDPGTHKGMHSILALKLGVAWSGPSFKISDEEWHFLSQLTGD
jgi:hypothetical protein